MPSSKMKNPLTSELCSTERSQGEGTGSGGGLYNQLPLIRNTHQGSTLTSQGVGYFKQQGQEVEDIGSLIATVVLAKCPVTHVLRGQPILAAIPPSGTTTKQSSHQD